MFRVSPGIDIKESEVPLIVSAISATIGATAGDFQWGPVLDSTSIINENELSETFGKPTNENFQSFFSASTYLSYSDNLRVVRTAQSGALNAVAGGTASPNTVMIKNDTHYDLLSFSEEDGYFAARYPGTLGNSLWVGICPPSSATFDDWTGPDGSSLVRYFDSAPGTSPYCSTRNVYNDEIHIIVIDEDGIISGTPGTVLERFPYCSLASDAVASDGTSSYYVDVIKNQSRFIIWLNHEASLESSRAGRTTDWVRTNTAQIDSQYVYFDSSLVGDSPLPVIAYSFVEGAIGDASGPSELEEAFGIYSDAEVNDISLLIGGPSPTNLTDALTHCNYVVNLAETRHDTMAFVSPPVFGSDGSAYYTDHEKAVIFADRISSSAFGVIDSCALKIYDKYNGVYRWIPANGSIAGLCARTDDSNYPWFSPAGYNRGILKNVVRISYNPPESERDELYKARINPIVQFAGHGTLLFGDKTALSRPSPFDRINVRRLFNILEKAISTSAKFMLFEFNDEFTRARFINLVEPYLRTVQANRGITDFRVVCDETNNTPYIIDSNQFVGSIYVRPNRSINFITLNFVSVGNTVEFEEII